MRIIATDHEIAERVRDLYAGAEVLIATNRDELMNAVQNGTVIIYQPGNFVEQIRELDNPLLAVIRMPYDERFI